MIEAVEAALEAAIKTGAADWPYKVPEIVSYAGQLDDLPSAVRLLPAIWMAYGGSERPELSDMENYRVPVKFAVMVAARSVRGELAARRGVTQGSLTLEVGAYRMLDDLTTLLTGRTLGLPIEPLAPGRTIFLHNTRLGGDAIVAYAQEWHTAWEFPAQHG